MSVVAAHFLGYLHLRYGEIEEALAEFTSILELEPHYYMAYIFAAVCHILLENYQQAEDLYLDSERIFGRKPILIGEMERLYLKWGKQAQADRLAAEMQEMAKSRYVSPTVLAWSPMFRGDTDAALDLLEQALEQKDSVLPICMLLPYPELEAMCGLPRFRVLIDKIGIRRCE